MLALKFILGICKKSRFFFCYGFFWANGQNGRKASVAWILTNSTLPQALG